MSALQKPQIVSPRRRLESWKEIAAFLNRSERTVRRWEDNEGLPVHRLQHDKRASVYAFSDELDSWRESRRTLLAAEPAEVTANEPVTVAPGRNVWRSTAVAIGLATVVVTIVGGLWSADRRPFAATHTPPPEVLRAYPMARFGDNAGRTQVQSGLRNYQEAVRLDPMFAAAWAGVANAHVALTWFGETPATETLKYAREEAESALKLDPTLTGAWRVLALTAHFLEWDHRAAETYYRRAISTGAPQGQAASLSWYGDLLTDLGRFDAALVEYRRSHDAAPRWLEPIAVGGNPHLFAGHFDLAIAEYQRALEIDPSYGLANHYLGRALFAQGLHEKGIAQLRKSNELLGAVPFAAADLGFSLGAGGHREEAEQMLADMMRRREHGYYPAFAIAEVQLALGHTDLALDWLERAVDEHNAGFYLPSVDPVYDSLRSNQRFQKLMSRMHLIPQSS